MLPIHHLFFSSIIPNLQHQNRYCCHISVQQFLSIISTNSCNYLLLKFLSCKNKQKILYHPSVSQNKFLSRQLCLSLGKFHNTVEILAAREGLRLASQCYWTQVILVVQAIGNLNCDSSSNGLLIEDTKCSLRGFDSARVHHVRQSANCEARRMVKLALISNFSSC